MSFRISEKSVAVLFALLGALAWSLAAAPAEAQVQDAGSQDTSILILFDASKSMQDDDGSGRPKIVAARAAVRDAIRGLPGVPEVGVRTFGATAKGKSRKAACRDSQLIVPIKPDSAKSISRKLRRVKPNGRTPIGYALRQAAQDLPAKGDRIVVLISDGGDNCSPPAPCSVAKQVSNEGVDFRIEAIGFRVGAAARAQLRCIARAGGGTYRDAGDSGELSKTLKQSFLRSLRSYQLEGKAIQGGKNEQDAPLVGVGQYTDGLIPGTQRWYRIPLKEGELLRAGVTLVPPLRRGLGGVGASATLDVVNPSRQRDSSGADSEPNLFNVSGAEPETLGVVTPAVGGDAGGDPARARIFSRPGGYFVRVALTDSANNDLREQLGPKRPIPFEVTFERLGQREVAADESANGPGFVGILVNALLYGAVGSLVGLAFGRFRAHKRSQKA